MENGEFEGLVGKLMDKFLETGKKTRERHRYSGDEKFAQVVVLLGPDLTPNVVPLVFTNEREKRIRMLAMAAAARHLRCPAVLMIMDCRWVNSDDFAKAMGLPPLKEMGVEKFRDEYHRIMGAMFDGQIKNLPRDCWHEMVAVIAKGPKLKDVMFRCAPYEKGEFDTIKWLPPHPEYTRQEWPMLPDWWRE